MKLLGSIITSVFVADNKHLFRLCSRLVYNFWYLSIDLPIQIDNRANFLKGASWILSIPYKFLNW